MTEVAALVIGGGPAGLSAAVQARELGADVTVLEAEQIGGTSLNRARPRSALWPGRPDWCGTGPLGSVLASRGPRQCPTSRASGVFLYQYNLIAAFPAQK